MKCGFLNISSVVSKAVLVSNRNLVRAGINSSFIEITVFSETLVQGGGVEAIFNSAFLIILGLIWKPNYCSFISSSTWTVTVLTLKTAFISSLDSAGFSQRVNSPTQSQSHPWLGPYIWYWSWKIDIFDIFPQYPILLYHYIFSQ